ncbi:MAG: class I SAM-dependent methyltransferase [Sandaracinaceae bacterium]
MTARGAEAAERLPTVLVPCPVCGEDDPRDRRSLPGQLLRVPQRFEAATCGSCAHRYLREQVHPDAFEALYDADYPLHRGPGQWGPFAHLVAAAEARVDRRRVDVVLRARALDADATVLDLGCGRGTFLRALHARTGASGLGVDSGLPPSPPEGPVRLLPGRLPDLPPEVDGHAPFDAVTLWPALAHDPAPAATLAWVRERLAPGGVLVLEVPDGSAPAAQRLGVRWAGFHTPRHVSLFDPSTLRRLLYRTGFRVRAHRRAGTLLPYTLLALTAADALGFRFGRHPAWALFGPWALGLGTTWPWLGRPELEGRGLQLLVAD